MCRTSKMIKGQEHLSYEERLRAGTVQPREGKTQGDLITVYKHQKGGCRKDRDQFFSVVPTDRTRGNRHKLNIWKFPLDIQKHFFTVRVTKHCYRLPREIVEPLSLEIFKSHLDMGLGKGPPVAQLQLGVGSPGLQRWLQTSTTLRFCEILCSKTLILISSLYNSQKCRKGCSSCLSRKLVVRAEPGGPQHMDGEGSSVNLNSSQLAGI